MNYPATATHAPLPAGDVAVNVTFLFTDIEGSTALWELDPATMRVALQRHNVLVSEAITQRGGCVFKTVGDAFCATFNRAPDAVLAAGEIQKRIHAELWPTATPLQIRIALHTGDAHFNEGDYFGATVNRCARLLAVTRAGQVLLSLATQRLAQTRYPPGMTLRDVGMHRLRDLALPVHVFQLVYAGLPSNLLEVQAPAPGAKSTSRPEAHFSPLGLVDVPTLPTVVTQLLKVMQDPNSTAQEVDRIISCDPAISAKLLRVANSAFFGAARSVATVTEAVSVLGFASVQGMVLGLTAFDAFRTARLDLEAFWEHSVMTGTAARYLAREARISADEAFTVGILHDIGKLVIVAQSDVDYQRVRELKKSTLEAERELFGFTHAEVGALMAERWQLPQIYVDAIAHHHDPARTTEILAAVVALAEDAAHAVCDAEALSAESVSTENASAEESRGLVLARLGLQPQVWPECLEHLRGAREDIEMFLAALH